jgi:hypothetical protein
VKRCVSAILCTLLAGGCLAATGLSAQAPEQFLIDSELWLDGERHELPALVISENDPGFLLETDEEGRVEEGGWRLEVSADPLDDPLALSEAIWLNVRLSLYEAGEWEPVLDSMLGVPEGEYSTLSVSGPDAIPSPETSEVYLRLLASRLRPGD